MIKSCKVRYPVQFNQSNAFPYIPLRHSHHHHHHHCFFRTQWCTRHKQKLLHNSWISCMHFCNQHGFVMTGHLPLLKHKHQILFSKNPACGTEALVAHTVISVDLNIVGRWMPCSRTKFNLKIILLIVFPGKRFTKLQRKTTPTGAKRKRNWSAFHNEYRIEFFLVDFGWPFIWYKTVATDFS